MYMYLYQESLLSGLEIQAHLFRVLIALSLKIYNGTFVVNSPGHYELVKIFVGLQFRPTFPCTNWNLSCPVPVQWPARPHLKRET